MVLPFATYPHYPSRSSRPWPRDCGGFGDWDCALKGGFCAPALGGGVFELAAPQIPAELFSFCIAAIPGPLAGIADFCCTPALELTLFHIEPNASPPDFDAAAGFVAGLPSVAIVVPDPNGDCDDCVVGDRAENGVVWLVGVALISALTDVK